MALSDQEAKKSLSKLLIKSGASDVSKDDVGFYEKVLQNCMFSCYYARNSFKTRESYYIQHVMSA